MKRPSLTSFICLLCVALLTLAAFPAALRAADKTLLNVSYDPTREFYTDINAAFAADWKRRTGENVIVRQSHGGSGKQARSVIDGLPADVVTLALASDIDALAEKAGLISADWQKRLPHHSAPYTSTIVLLVRKGNPKGIKDWEDLVKPGVAVITPNPKTSGGARWNYLAAWGFAEGRFNGDPAKVREFMRKLYQNVRVLDTGARGSTITFAQRGIGDVLISWENEVILASREFGAGKFDVITPSISIQAEPPVAWVDAVVKKHGTEALAKAYLEFLYSEPAQDIAGKHYYRPRSEQAAAKYRAQFPEIKLLSIDDNFGGWKKAQQTHFSDGGTFDQTYRPEKNSARP